NAFHPLARVLWLQANEPAAWAATHQVLEPKDYLNLRLTGRAMSDHVSQHWLAQALDGGCASLAARTGIKRNPLPPLGNAWTEVGRVRADLPDVLACMADARVFCGANDTWAAATGLGAMRAGYAYCVSGTSEVFGLVADHAGQADGLITIPWGASLWQLGGPSQSGAGTLQRVVDLVAPGREPIGVRINRLLQMP